MAKPITIQLPKLHSGQNTVRKSPARFKVIDCGRRWGKSRLASALITEKALQGGVCWVVVPVYALGGPMFDDLRRLASQIPGAEVNRSDRLIRYPGGGLAQVKTGDDPALLRGVALDLVAFDEAAFMPKLQELWQETIRPALADRKGKALFLSTPNGQNYFWQLFQLGQDEQETDWQSWQMPTSSNPYIDQTEIEAARRSMAERQFSQEFLAEFVEDGSVFRNVTELATAKPQNGPTAGNVYFMGIDWGRTNDSTVIVVYDATAKAFVYLDRFSGLPFDIQLNRVEVAVNTWRPRTTVVERNSFGQALLESLQKRRLPTRLIGFNTDNTGKGQLVDCLALALERREIALLDHPVLVAELQAYQAETLPSGLTRYSAPSGGHDDTVMAALLAFGPSSDVAPDELRPTMAVLPMQAKAKDKRLSMGGSIVTTNGVTRPNPQRVHRSS